MNATACYFVNGMESETSAIARGLRRRDPDLLDRLIEQYQHRLLRYLVSLTADRAIAEDLFQETWMRVLERSHQYDGRHDFSTWLYTIARNLTIDHLRRKRPAVSLDALMEAEDSALPYEPASAGPSALDTVAAGWGRPPAFPEYLFFATIETVATSVIIWRAWTWSEVKTEVSSERIARQAAAGITSSS